MKHGFAYFLQQAYVLRAIEVAALVALCAALLGVSLVLKRYSLIGDGLSHVAFGATAVAAVFGWAELYVSLPITVLCAVLLLRSGSRAKIKGDAAVALISVTSLAAAYLLFSKFSTGNVNADVCKTLFGSASILYLRPSDVRMCVILTAIVLLFFLLFYHKIYAVTFDDAFARATGVRSGRYELLLAVVTGVTIVLATKLVGALLITALIVFPTLSAMRLFGSFRGVTICAAVISVVCAVLGILISLVISAPVGSCIVMADYVVFLMAFAVSLLIGRDR